MKLPQGGYLPSLGHRCLQPLLELKVTTTMGPAADLPSALFLPLRAHSVWFALVTT